MRTAQCVSSRVRGAAVEFRVSAAFGAEIEMDGTGGAVRDKQANKEVGMTPRKTARTDGHERELVTRRSCNRN